ncbi:MAG: cytochrome c family protein [Planctomycetota bacterium]
MASSSLLAIGCGLFLLPIFFVPPGPGAAAPVPEAAAANRFIGAKACKNCHDGAEKGNMFDHWSKTPHAKAYETLASDKAKEVGKKHGVDDPQKSDKCVQCHVTAFGVDAKEIKRGFKTEDGVQCESCHGPGENHAKLRLKESQTGGTPAPVSAEEIETGRDAKHCQKCHNEKSPTYKPFCLKERMEVIEHLDPRKKRSEEELKKLRATCYPECPKCSEKKSDDGKGEDK